MGKDKGKKGIIMKVVEERNWCFVKGLHLVSYTHRFVRTKEVYFHQIMQYLITCHPLFVNAYGLRCWSFLLQFPYESSTFIKIASLFLNRYCLTVIAHKCHGERGGLVVESLTPEREVGRSIPISAVLCP